MKNLLNECMRLFWWGTRIDIDYCSDRSQNRLVYEYIIST